MAGDQQLHVARNATASIIEVTGKLDEETALGLGQLLDDELAVGSVMTVRIADAEISMIGWVVLERAERTWARRGARLEVEPDPGPEAPERRMARVWLDVIEAACRQTGASEVPDAKR